MNYSDFYDGLIHMGFSVHKSKITPMIKYYYGEGIKIEPYDNGYNIIYNDETILISKVGTGQNKMRKEVFNFVKNKIRSNRINKIIENK